MKKWILLMLLTSCAAAFAADDKDDLALKPGKQTREWLDLQKSGTAAAGPAKPMPGEVADKVYQRYVDSFGHPIPETYERDSFKSGSQGK